MDEDRHLIVLLVGFGGPESLDVVPAFVESVLGRKPPEHVISSATARYAAIGGKSPLPATTRRQAVRVGEELSRRGFSAEVHVGMLHARPTIEDAVARITSAGIDDLIVVSLAPYRCEVSTDAYETEVKKSLRQSRLRLRFAPDWNKEPGYINALANVLSEALEEAPSDIPVIFTAHSLPQRMIAQGDPYADQLAATAGEVAQHLGLTDWHLAYQSVSAAAREPWLGPSVVEVMERLAANGATSVLVDPIGFISDHVETLYDNDIEHQVRAKELGLVFYRCRCLNDHPGLIDTLADIVTATADRG